MNATVSPWLSSAVARHVWQTRYRRMRDGMPQEETIEDSWRRVADALAAAEAAGQSDWAERFYGILQGFRFLPGGRILAGAGSGRRVTLFNCFVMGLIEDDMEGIFEALKEGALTMQAGGGVGYDFSTLRPVGSMARMSGRIASGPVSFMSVWDAMCGTLLSTGARRGAMLASLRCDHPDIGDFIEAKRVAGRLSRFNLSVQVTDAFMQAVRDDDDWPLVFPDASLQPQNDAELVRRDWPGCEGPVACRVMDRRPARQLWERLIRSAYETAEPGVLFIDRINGYNNLSYREYISTANPCGELPLPPYGACDLGSVNLVQFVRDPFTPGARLDLEAICTTVTIATRLLDNVIDCSQFPLDRQAEQAHGSRRIGLGITGLADALIMLGLHYADAAGRREAARAMQAVCHTAYRASIELAKEKGPFPWFVADAYLRCPFVQALPQDIREGIAAYGIRNSHLTAIAPAGTISLLANNISSGIEPVFDFRHSRRILNRAGEYERFELTDYALAQYRDPARTDGRLPEAFVAARDLAPAAHLAMQAALQPFVDSAISKTVNVPEDCPLDVFRNIYRHAWELGLKGCTTYRPGTVRGEILATDIGEGGIADAHCCSIEREGE